MLKLRKGNFIAILAASLMLVIGLIYVNLRKPSIKSNFSNRDIVSSCNTSNFSGLIDYSEKVAHFEGENINIDSLAFVDRKPNVLGLASEERWVEVDLSEQKLRAWEGADLFLETSVSTGLPWWPTPTGEFRIWVKLRATKMEGGSGANYYYLPNVPYVMYFGNSDVPNWRGYGLHGTYWHNDFGNPRSHGCVNLPTPIAEQLYYWVAPNLPDGKSAVFSSAENPGTRVWIHE